ncbi:MAG: quinolinate synthase NadA [Pseudomonadota bacterium]
MPINETMPDKYREMDEAELRRRIAAVKERMGKELLILGHYYQRDEVAGFADIEGDSFALAKEGAESEAKWIVFCGVHFMAEASVILARPGQRVFLPDMDAGCPLADMASIEQVEAAWRALEAAGTAGDFLPITYMNSTAELKAFCGKKGGAVCTSSSASRAFEWATGQGKRIFFFPDENLGRNTARSLLMSDDDVALWDPAVKGGGIDAAKIRGARLIVWKGYCHVHTYFTPEHVGKARAAYLGCRIVVHPECNPEVVDLSDSQGSTAYLKKYAEDAPDGSTVVIGTEINLVARLARKHPEKKIVPLARSLCPNMFKISLADLCWTLENLGQVNEVFVSEDVARDAKLALDRMLAI